MSEQNQAKQFSNQDVKVLAKDTVYQGFFKMVKYRIQHKLFAGGWGKTIEREIFERGHAVAVLPYDPVLDEVVLIEQFRMGAVATSDSPWLYECIAGMVDHGYTPEQVCHKETLEEAGLTIIKLEPMLSYLSSPGGTTERLHLYVAHVDASQAKGLHGLDEEGEDIKVHRFSSAAAFAMLAEGKLDNAATLICMQWLQLHKAKLQQQWLGEA